MYYDIYYACIPQETLHVVSLFCWNLDSSLSLLFLLPWTALVKVMTSGALLPIVPTEENKDEAEPLQKTPSSTAGQDLRNTLVTIK
jgi:hypothetical protein